MSLIDLIKALEQLQPYQTYISIACIVGMIAPLTALAVSKPKDEKTPPPKFAYHYGGLFHILNSVFIHSRHSVASFDRICHDS